MRLFLLILLCGLLQTAQNHATAQTNPEPFTHTLNFESSNPNHPYLWDTTAWEECLGICDTATQSRQVNCVGGGQIATDESKCNAHEKPLETRACMGPCGGATCAPKPTCEAGMVAFKTGMIQTGTDQNDCDTWICVSESCALTPSCGNGSTSTYSGLDSNTCPIWTCSTAPATGNCPPKPKCGAGKSAGWAGQWHFPGCRKYFCKTNTCYEGVPLNGCPSGNGYHLRTVGTNPATGCKINACVPTESGSSSSSSSSGGTSSCPATPSCGSGKTLKNNGKNSAGCTQWSCVAKSCPSKPSCGLGQTLTSTGKDAYGCTTYQCKY